MINIDRLGRLAAVCEPQRETHSIRWDDDKERNSGTAFCNGRPCVDFLIEHDYFMGRRKAILIHAGDVLFTTE